MHGQKARSRICNGGIWSDGTVQMPPTRDGGAIFFEICDIPATFLPPALLGRTGKTFSP
jgi:hypothetical protein